MPSERIFPALITLAVAVMFLIFGLVFRKGKGTGLIAGYNTASAEEKRKTDEKALCRFVARLMFFYTACFGLLSLGILTGTDSAFKWIMPIFLIVTVIAVIYANTGNRFKKR